MKEVCQTFNLWTVISSEKKNGVHYKIVRCQCGSVKSVQLGALKNGKSKSCGCFQRQTAKQLHITHGYGYHALYGVWRGMISRCNNANHKSYKFYGARGINVDAKWMDIENFIKDMFPTFKKGLTLERVNNNLGYSKENCIWATRKHQSKNRRSNILITIGNETKCLSDWCRQQKLIFGTVRSRIVSGKKPEEALEIFK